MKKNFLCLLIPAAAVLFYILSVIRRRRDGKRLKEKLLSDISHELKTPLNGIIGLNRLMSDSLDDPEKMRSYLKKSDKAAKELLSKLNGRLYPVGELAYKGKKVLAAEDNDLNWEILSELLRASGIPADRAENGKEAVELFSLSPVGYYSVILMDIRMPEMDGYEAARHIRRMKRPDSSTVVIIACSANDMPADREKAFESGMNDFMPKPVDAAALMNKLRLYEQTA